MNDRTDGEVPYWQCCCSSRAYMIEIDANSNIYDGMYMGLSLYFIERRYHRLSSQNVQNRSIKLSQRAEKKQHTTSNPVAFDCTHGHHKQSGECTGMREGKLSRAYIHMPGVGVADGREMQCRSSREATREPKLCGSRARRERARARILAGPGIGGARRATLCAFRLMKLEVRRLLAARVSYSPSTRRSYRLADYILWGILIPRYMGNS